MEKEELRASDERVLDSMVGLFVIYAASAGLAILLRALNLRKKDVDAAADDDEADVRDAWVEEDAKVHDVSPSDASFGLWMARKLVERMSGATLLGG